MVSDACSGIDQTAGEFAGIFAHVQRRRTAGTTVPHGERRPHRRRLDDRPPPPATGARPPIVDDPATSPYPIWNVNQAYPKGTKIVWHHNVYQAKWYSIGDQPDTSGRDQPIKRRGR